MECASLYIANFPFQVSVCRKIGDPEEYEDTYVLYPSKVQCSAQTINIPTSSIMLRYTPLLLPMSEWSLAMVTDSLLMNRGCSCTSMDISWLCDESVSGMIPDSTSSRLLMISLMAGDLREPIETSE